MINPQKPIAGFTLIELLIAVAIIAVLAVLAVTYYGNIQSNARDTKRKAEIHALAGALEINKFNGFYTPLSKSQLSGRVWPGETVGGSASALDPQGYPYCIVLSTSGTALSPTSVSGWERTSSCASSNGGIPIDNTNMTSVAFTDVNAWSVCTRLENAGNPVVYCQGNAQ